MPTLQKWINLTCDPRRVAEIWNESQSSDKPLDIEIVATRVKEFCKLLASLKPTNSDYIMLALKFYESGIETIDAELIKGDDLHRAGMFLRDEFILKEKPFPSISPNSSNQELEAFWSKPLDGCHRHLPTNTLHGKKFLAHLYCFRMLLMWEMRSSWLLHSTICHSMA